MTQRFEFLIFGNAAEHQESYGNGIIRDRRSPDLSGRNFFEITLTHDLLLLPLPRFISSSKSKKQVTPDKIKHTWKSPILLYEDAHVFTRNRLSGISLPLLSFHLKPA
jgi:hypothetical protein